jgi:hypothetical protein
MDGVDFGLSIEELERGEESQAIGSEADEELLEHLDRCNGRDDCWRPEFDGVCYSSSAFLS